MDKTSRKRNLGGIIYMGVFGIGVVGLVGALTLHANKWNQDARDRERGIFALALLYKMGLEPKEMRAYDNNPRDGYLDSNELDNLLRDFGIRYR